MAAVADKSKPSLADNLISEFKSLQTKFDAVSTELVEVKKKLNDPVPTVPAVPIDRKEELKKGFRTPREFISTVMDASMGKPMDPRLKSLRVTTKAAGSDEQLVANDPYGGYTVPPAFQPEILRLDPEEDPMGAMTRKIPMATPVVKINARVDKNHTTSVSGGLTVTRRPETVAGSATRMEFEQISLNAHNLFGVGIATEELLHDSPQSFAAIIASGFEDQFKYHIIGERIGGTGVGEYEGILTCPALITVDAEIGQDADTILFENVVKMRARCWNYSQAIWLANHDTLPQLMQMNQNVGLGGVPAWLPSAREDHPDILLGRPLIFSEYAKTVGDVGDLILGVWSEYLEGTLETLQNQESIHVRFLNHERVWKFWTRNAGAPWWRSPLTPKNSQATLSPFVVLAGR